MQHRDLEIQKVQISEHLYKTITAEGFLFFSTEANIPINQIIFHRRKYSPNFISVMASESNRDHL